MFPFCRSRLATHEPLELTRLGKHVPLPGASQSTRFLVCCRHSTLSPIPSRFFPARSQLDPVRRAPRRRHAAHHLRRLIKFVPASRP